MIALSATVVASALATVATAWAVRRLMLRLGVVDIPNHRSSHAITTARGGGLACVAGVLAGTCVAWLAGAHIPWLTLCGSAILAGVGFADDIFGLPAMPRLLAQVAVGLVFGALSGGLWAGVAGGVLYPLVVNVVNFMDGINGISGAVMAAWCGTTLVLGIGGNFGALSVLGALGLGAAIGFLPWNVPVARLFLGDVGSYFFGGLMAGGILLGSTQGVPFSLLLAPLAIYLGDVIWTLCRRAHRREPLLEAHRDHAYQRLVRVKGMSHARVSVLVAAGSAIIAGLWILTTAWVAAVLTVPLVIGFILLPDAGRWRMA